MNRQIFRRCEVRIGRGLPSECPPQDFLSLDGARVVAGINNHKRGSKQCHSIVVCPDARDLVVTNSLKISIRSRGGRSRSKESILKIVVETRTNDVVCKAHFLPSDYRSMLLG